MAYHTETTEGNQISLLRHNTVMHHKILKQFCMISLDTNRVEDYHTSVKSGQN